jgi:catechol 2,3-dioxygenase-like lactoylglutathione lyase family enzyme
MLVVMTAVTRINHVSVHATDLAASVEFYVDVLGAERMAAPNFGFPVAWLAIGESQLHLFQAAAEPQGNRHFALTVEHLEPVYRRAEARGAFDYEAFGNHLVELPGGVVQTYLRDPSGNLIELDTPDAARLPDALRRQVKRIEDIRPQTEENLSARLSVNRPR